MAAELLDWCTATPRPTAGRLLHGPGGIGKTRLLIHVAAELREHGWIAGFLDRPHEEIEATLKQRWQALDQLIAHGDDAGLLLVLDYAEGRQDELVRLARRLAERPESDTRPVRLVLLARSAGEWWERLVEEQSGARTVATPARRATDVQSLASISPPEQRRLDLFAASRAEFAPILMAQGSAPKAGEPAPDHLQRLVRSREFERPLAIQMDALLWLASNSLGADPITIEQMLSNILGMEHAHWHKLLGRLDENTVRDLARGISQITLVQGVASRSSAERLLMADSFYGNTRTARVAVGPKSSVPLAVSMVAAMPLVQWSQI